MKNGLTYLGLLILAGLAGAVYLISTGEKGKFARCEVVECDQLSHCRCAK